MKMSATIPIPVHVDEVETHKMAVLTPAEKHMKIVGEEKQSEIHKGELICYQISYMMF